MGVEGEDVLYAPQVSSFLLRKASLDHIADSMLRQSNTVAFISQYDMVVAVPRGARELGPKTWTFLSSHPSTPFSGSSSWKERGCC